MKDFRLRLGLLLLVAALVACDEGFSEEDKEAMNEEQHCVDENGNYVDDKECEQSDAGTSRAYGYSDVHAHGQTVVVYPHYHYVYVPHGYYAGVGYPSEGFSSATAPGSGSALVSSGKAVTAAPAAHSSFVSRGGFGSGGRAGGTVSSGAGRGGFGASAAGHGASSGS